MQILQEAYYAQGDKIMAAFFKGVQNEFKKIVWPTKELLAKETFAVIVISIILGVIIALLDWVFQLGLGLVIK